MQQACLEFLLSRRSIRKFLDREVPDELVMKALDVARYAPSAKNLQPWLFVVVKKRELLDKLSRIHVGARPLTEAKLAIVVFGDPAISKSYMIDASLAALYLWLALHCLGLGAVWIQTVGYEKVICEILGVDERLKPVAILAVGWPAEKPEAKPRKPLEEVVKVIA